MSQMSLIDYMDYGNPLVSTMTETLRTLFALIRILSPCAASTQMVKGGTDFFGG